jgi:predicted nucleotidyltransferase
VWNLPEAAGTVPGVTQAEVIQEITRLLEEAVPAGSEVLLFGSRARDNAADDSDYDVLIIEPKVERPMEEAVRLRRVLNGLPCPFDIVVMSADRAASRARVRGTVVERARREGKVLVRT